MLGNIVGINYEHIFQSVIADKKVRGMLADFIVYCFQECVELEDALVQKFKDNKELERIIDDRILALAGQHETKRRFTQRLKEENNV